jgi:hypothetical protein
MSPSDVDSDVSSNGHVSDNLVSGIDNGIHSHIGMVLCIILQTLLRRISLKYVLDLQIYVTMC